MLVLTRKVREQIVLGKDIRVTVLAIEGDRVRLGFSAPAEVIIRRQELLAGGAHTSASLSAPPARS